MLKVFDILHPGCIAVVAYDNSANHHAMAGDALIANRLNLKDGGKTQAANVQDGFLLRMALALSKLCRRLMGNKKEAAQS